MRNIILVLFLFSLGHSYGQATNPNVKNDSLNSIQHISKTTLYFDLAGSSFIYSLGVDRIILYKNYLKISLSCGYGLVPFEGLIHLLSPQLNFIVGESNHHFESGLGYLFDLSDSDLSNPDLFSARIGYRYQKKHGGFYFKTGLSFLSMLGGEINGAILPGFAFGYTLK
jgi:hypothetical protein